MRMKCFYMLAAILFVIAVIFEIRNLRSLATALPCLTTQYSPVTKRGNEGFSQGGAVSGGIFLGTPFRSFSGRRIFGKGWEAQAEKNYLDWDTVARYVAASVGTTSVSTKACSRWGVVTTISFPTKAIQDVARLRDKWCLVIVGDKETPQDYKVSDPVLKDNDSVFFFDVQEQTAWSQIPGELGEFVKAIPFNSFARKNLGYIYAILRGAEFIFDFDDDNYLHIDAFGNPLNPIPNEKHVENVRLVSVDLRHFNHHPLMGASVNESWARGFPLEKVRDNKTYGERISQGRNISMTEVAVIQYCANGDPDIDAVHRMTKPLPMNFASDVYSSPLKVPTTATAPYNSQATIHHYPALFATLLPISVNSRVSDIWRAYYAYPFFRDLKLSLIYAPPRVTQIRHVHSYIADMKAESDIYFKGHKLTDFVQDWKSNDESIPTRMEQLWIDLYERGFHEIEDIYLVQKWLASLVQIQYEFSEIARG